MAFEKGNIEFFTKNLQRAMEAGIPHGKLPAIWDSREWELPFEQDWTSIEREYLTEKDDRPSITGTAGFFGKRPATSTG